MKGYIPRWPLWALLGAGVALIAAGRAIRAYDTRVCDWANVTGEDQ